MKIKIESRSSGHSTFGVPFKKPEIRNSWIVLDFFLEMQLLGRWCWAAISSKAANYYKGIQLSQQEVASRTLGIDCSNILNDPEVSEKGNVNTTLDLSLKEVGCFSHWSLGKPSFERIQHEINLGHPVAFRVEWYQGGAHYAVIKGYDVKGERVAVEDSIYGASTQLYADFPRTYSNGGGVWTDTFWLKYQEQTD